MSLFSTFIHIPAENALIPKVLNIYGWLERKQILFMKCEHEIDTSGVSLRMIFSREEDASAAAVKFEGEFRQVSGHDAN
jgi:hypothetical protein